MATVDDKKIIFSMVGAVSYTHLSVGVEQEAYNEGLAYAKERAQFGEKIINFPAVYDMLSRMKAKLDAGRSLLYCCARYVDIYLSLIHISCWHKSCGRSPSVDLRGQHPQSLVR